MVEQSFDAKRERNISDLKHTEIIVFFSYSLYIWFKQDKLHCPGPHFTEICYDSNSARMATTKTTSGILLPDWL